MSAAAIKTVLLALALLAALRTTGARAEEPDRQYTNESLRGKVVWLAEALDRRFGLKTDDDTLHAVAAMECADGQLQPLLKDARGRAFYSDERLRGVDVEVSVRRYRGAPMLQVVRVYLLKPDGKYEVDYWCDVCSIAMYEPKACECCQGPIHLRQRRVDEPNGGDKERP